MINWNKAITIFLYVIVFTILFPVNIFYNDKAPIEEIAFALFMNIAFLCSQFFARKIDKNSIFHTDIYNNSTFRNLFLAVIVFNLLFLIPKIGLLDSFVKYIFFLANIAVYTYAIWLIKKEKKLKENEIFLHQTFISQ